MSPVRAVVLDTDGVLLDSAALHAAAWKSAFDGCLEAWAAGTGHPAQLPFDAERECRELVDGKPRLDGALAFLTARGIARTASPRSSSTWPPPNWPGTGRAERPHPGPDGPKRSSRPPHDSEGRHHVKALKRTTTESNGESP